MASKTLQKVLRDVKLFTYLCSNPLLTRSLVSKQSGAYFPPPKKVPLGVIRVILTVIPGLLIGAGISKTIANFLEENDLFVPSDDDDDDD